MSIGGHQSAKMGKDEWLTPPEIINALGGFDLDPCSPVNRPWDTAKQHYTIDDNGLLKEWHGRVFCNPPYGRATGRWLGRCAEHRDCTALIFARTETAMFFEFVWPKAKALLFIEGRLHFHHVDGTRASSNAGAPSVLVAWDYKNAGALAGCGIKGQFVGL